MLMSSSMCPQPLHPGRSMSLLLEFCCAQRIATHSPKGGVSLFLAVSSDRSEPRLFLNETVCSKHLALWIVGRQQAAPRLNFAGRRAGGHVENALDKGMALARGFYDRAKPKVKKAGDSSMEKAKELADKTSDTVARGVHKAMGSAEYRKKAEEVNRDLERVLRSLEDSIKRRDEEIKRLRAHVADLESRLRGT